MFICLGQADCWIPQKHGSKILGHMDSLSITPHKSLEKAETKNNMIFLRFCSISNFQDGWLVFG